MTICSYVNYINNYCNRYYYNRETCNLNCSQVHNCFLLREYNFNYNLYRSINFSNFCNLVNNFCTIFIHLNNSCLNILSIKYYYHRYRILVYNFYKFNLQKINKIHLNKKCKISRGNILCNFPYICDRFIL